MKVYVVTHKPFDGRLPENYEYIQVNAANNARFCALTDDTGENISAKNPCYCELTAMYWIWKNDHENDIVGLAHYRRFLTTNKFSSSPRHYIGAKRAEKLLQKYDFLATKQYRSDCTVWEHILSDVHEGDLELLRETAAEICPDYLEAFDEVMKGKKSYLCNMFLCKKQTWDSYCAWLFSLLFALEPKVDMTGYTVQEKRLYGFLAERLFSVYVKKNGCNVKSFSTHLVGVSKTRQAINKLKRMLHLGSVR